jgi:acyl-CoA reductase-like NAD-dependent aldehyde dehydrogenase
VKEVCLTYENNKEIMMPPDFDIASECQQLSHAADRWRSVVPRERAELAMRTAQSIGSKSEAWVRAAVAMKSVGPDGQDACTDRLRSVLRAEECATGPIATLRLLFLTAQALQSIGKIGVPGTSVSPRMTHGQNQIHESPFGSPSSFVAVDVLPVCKLYDPTIFRGHRATVRCANTGSVETFMKLWQEECRPSPDAEGVAVVLGAGNVTGLAAADAVCQIFEHGRAVLLKLHPVQASLAPVLQAALSPLVEADLLRVVVGGAALVCDAISTQEVTAMHLTGGEETFRNVVSSNKSKLRTKSITCELGNVTPWIIVPGNYSEKDLCFQADQIAASIANNSSFNCIATKVILTSRHWAQRQRFLDRIEQRLRSLPARPAWYPGAADLHHKATGDSVQDGCLQPKLLRDVYRESHPHWFAREWFIPIAVETTMEGETIEDFCVAASRVVHDLPGNLAASVTRPDRMATHDESRVELLIEHLRYGVVAVNAWSALAYAVANIPWGGFPGGTIEAPESGLGYVHNPYFLPLVQNSILRAPLRVWPTPPWFPWHSKGGQLAGGVAEMYSAIAAGKSGLWNLVGMLPDVIRG